MRRNDEVALVPVTTAYTSTQMLISTQIRVNRVERLAKALFSGLQAAIEAARQIALELPELKFLSQQLTHFADSLLGAGKKQAATEESDSAAA